ncbi:zinc ribbon domain-containing protein [Acinetobacter calcoaceticus]|uniref:zinc ribbon domain-containing protein n=1 Tax=Acinetobacter TaxID=469 RepID=UPI000519B884|nr:MULTISPECIES: zinc ribbon domain-containing protein [Acinetobacter]MBJ8417841.1 zinc ribbon domain-containing protein [Acinetobacter courvalinii]WPE79994.1 zinc ribbon domain-containing protein [Acinetobacter baumannii]
MALISCPECSSQVSTQANSCPHCGYPLQTQRHTPESGALQSPHVLSRAIMALGAWLVTPWIARLLFGLAVLVFAYFLLKSK